MTSNIRNRYVLSFDVGTKNLAYCLISENRKILLWNVINISHSSKEGRCNKLIESLDQINYGTPEKNQKSEDVFRQIEVIIESQMSRNRIMMEVAAQILMYYAMEKTGIKNNVNSNPPVVITKVIMYSPKYKLRAYVREPGDEPLKPIKAKLNTYSYRKNQAKQHCGIMIKRNQSEEILDIFKKNKAKQDDLSDSFLQAVAYLMKL